MRATKSLIIFGCIAGLLRAESLTLPLEQRPSWPEPGRGRDGRQLGAAPVSRPPGWS